MSSDYIIEKIETKTELFTLKVNNFFIHSRYNPKKEAEQFANEKFQENHLHILFGYGLGYFADALKKKMNENSELLVVDPIINEIKSITKVDAGIIDVVDEKRIEKKMSEILQGSKVNVTVICAPNYDKLFPAEYKKILNTVRDILNINRMQRNTINFFAESWQENYIRNLIYIAQDESLVKLKNKFNSPIVVASGGPSLNKQIPKLKEIRDQVILIASGSTINTLLHYNIEPDFVVSIDGGEANYTHFKGTIFTKAHLIYSIRNHFRIRNQFRSTSFSFIPAFEPEVAKHVQKLTGKELPIISGGTSVAVYALTIALYMSSGQIALIGQDLAYTDNKTHAEHNRHFQEVDENYKKNRGTFFTEGYYGQEVLTDTAFLSMKKGFEQLVEVSKQNNRIYNCTEGGVKIKGIKQIPFNKFCEQVQEDTIEIFLNNEVTLDLVGFKNNLQGEIELYKQLSRQLQKGLKLLRANQSDELFDSKIVKGLNNVDKQLKKLFNKVSMNSIVDPITLDTLNNFLPKQNETEQEKFTRVYDQNNQLYKRLFEATKLSKQYTMDLLKDIDANYGE